jgi:hypothetical protein
VRLLLCNGYAKLAAVRSRPPAAAIDSGAAHQQLRGSRAGGSGAHCTAHKAPNATADGAERQRGAAREERTTSATPATAGYRRGRAPLARRAAAAAHGRRQGGGSLSPACCCPLLARPQPAATHAAAHRQQSGDPAHETDRKILKSAQQGSKITYRHYGLNVNRFVMLTHGPQQGPNNRQISKVSVFLMFGRIGVIVRLFGSKHSAFR